MNILSVNDYYPPCPMGGAEIISHELNVLLTKRGHNVYVLTTYPRPVKKQVSGVKGVYWVPHRSSSNPFVAALKNNYITPLRMADKLLRIVREKEIDVIHALNGNSALAVMYAKMLSDSLPLSILSFVSYIHVCPFGDALHSRGAKECANLRHIIECARLRFTKEMYIPFCLPFGLFQYVNSRLLKRAVKAFDYYTALSNYIKEVMMKCLGIFPERIDVLYPIANPKMLLPKRLQDEIRNDSSEKIVLYVGRLSEEKGVRVLVEAISKVLTRYRDVKFVFVGDGPLRNVIKQKMAADLADKITLTGKVSHEKVGCYYSMANIVAIPSLWDEPFGLVALEAFTSKRAVIASNAGGLKEALGDAGVFVKPGDPEELADRIVELLEDNGLRIQLGLKGYKRACEMFDAGRTVKRLEGIYRRLVEARGRL